MLIEKLIECCYDMEPYKLEHFITRKGLSLQKVLTEAEIAHKRNPPDYRLDILVDTLRSMTQEKLWNVIPEIEEEIKRRTSPRG